MLHKEFWGLLFLAFVGWIFVSSSPNERIEHFCRPVKWSGNISTSIASLIVPSQQQNVQVWFDKFDYGCQYMTWRLLYQADYNKALGVTENQQIPSDETLQKGSTHGAPVPGDDAAKKDAK